MTDRENKQSTSDGSFADKTNGRAPGSRGPSQRNRVTIESVRETIGTRQASLLERRTLPQITKQVERKLIVRLSLVAVCNCLITLAICVALQYNVQRWTRLSLDQRFR